MPNQDESDETTFVLAEGLTVKIDIFSKLVVHDDKENCEEAHGKLD
jgi:hypothetical protein